MKKKKAELIANLQMPMNLDALREILGAFSRGREGLQVDAAEKCLYVYTIKTDGKRPTHQKT